LDSWDIRSLHIEPHHPQVLRSDDESRVIAINLPAGEELQDHQTYERAYLVVVDGQVEVQQDGNESQRGGPGFVAHIPPNERHEVRASTDSMLLLILSPWPGEGHPSRRAG
jgi:quercetin dioxygenase-like cupin family protein